MAIIQKKLLKKLNGEILFKRHWVKEILGIQSHNNMPSVI